MGTDSDNIDNTMNTMWASDDTAAGGLDADCNPNRVCRNARAFGFEGFAEEGEDVQAAWRQTLIRENKLASSGESIRDLILGPSTSK